MTITRIHQTPEASDPAAPALREGARRIGRKELRDAVEVLARDLAQRGLRPGDRLLIVAENGAALVALILAASRLDAVSVPVNARLTAPELDLVVAHAEPRLTVWTTDVSPDALAHAQRAGGQGWRTPMGRLHLSAAADTMPEVLLPGAEQVAAILYTTGTTGTPKGVMLSHANLIFGARTSTAMRGIAGGDVLLGVLPITHVFGLTSMMLASLIGGAELWLFPRFSAAAALDALADGVSVVPAVPQIHALLLAEAASRGLARVPGKTLRYVSSGAAPLDPDLKRRAEAFYGIALQNGYGLTESTAGITLSENPMGDPDLSVGLPLPGVELRLCDPGADGVGAIMTRGPHVFAGYFRNPAATAEVLDPDGFLATGDLGRLDDRGRLHIAGRARELILRGGFSVYPPEVEAALASHPEVLHCAVVGRVVADGNEEVLAFCQADPACVTAAELHAHAAARLVSYKRPSRIVLAAALPAAPTGKILKSRLIETFREALDGSGG